MIRNRKPALWKVIIKFACCLLLIVMIITFFAATIQISLDFDDDQDIAGQVGICDRCYYERNFPELRDTIRVYSAYGPEFAVYHEAVRGYEDYTSWVQWSKAEKMNLPQSAEKAEYYKNKVYDNLKNVKYEANKPIMQNFADRMENQ